MLVSGPIGISVSGRSRSLRAISSTAWSGSGSRDGGGRSGPSRPGLAVHLAGGLGRGGSAPRSAPAATGMCVAPDHVQHADRVGRHLLERLVARHGRDGRRSPARGSPAASRRAIASSWPGSQSMITGVGMAHHPGGSRVRTLSCTSPPSSSPPSSPRPLRPPRPARAESVTTGSAAVTGTVNPGGDATTYQFEYGTSASYGLTTPDADAGSGTDRRRRQGDALEPDDEHDLPLPARGHQRRRRRARDRQDLQDQRARRRRRRSPRAPRRR